MPHLLIAAPHKSSGKTTVSLGLAAALARRCLRVQPFKKGPDYIDPMWLGRATGRACYNLDFNSMSEAEIRETFCRRTADAELGLIEGNMGLYDSLELDGRQSNAALAALLDAPVLLVVSTIGMTRSVVALIRGFMDFEPRVRIGGIILNRLASTRHEQRIREAIAHYLDVPVLGAVHQQAGLAIGERHLGLVPSNESNAADEVLARLADAVEAQVDLEAVRELAHSAGAVVTPPSVRRSPPAADLRIGIAEDAAFGFYYASDREQFAASGARLVPFSPLHDHRLPEVDGLFIGGGFPETHMHALAANGAMRNALRQAIEQGLPVYAECGGLMYLCRRIRWQAQSAEMVGVVPADAVLHARPQGKGYVRLQETVHMPWAGGSGTLHAHEFHYSTLEGLPADAPFAYRVLRGSGIDGRGDGYVYKNLLATYAHLHHGAANPWVDRFLHTVRARKRASAA